ncbi:hypothetical protein K2173_025212 [Erythroxylum novogranatense]|uniref:Short-chain dehydrogenase/reductase n=1 Tax=Erythroxylum novogranatense TaxID=1862640 RepID=A0AAV8UD66_9ROSI|nr:hypothetical protein K2173_025212 [Erythroxylum novogranatense]
MAEATRKYAVVTGGNKGIGFEICRQLASNGIVVILTSRDEKRGLEAIEKLKKSGISSDYVMFQQLDVADTDSIASLADFVKNRAGKLDILVNNAGVSGIQLDVEAWRASGAGQIGTELTSQTYDSAEECLRINYDGARRMIEALVPLLQLSDSPRIVNVSSSMGKLQNLSNEWAKGVLGDAENLTEQRVDEVLNQFLEDFKEDSLETEGWPLFLPAYVVSKAAMNAYTRIVAKKYPNFCVNSVCPGFVKTDINYQTGVLPVEEGAESPVRLALLPTGGPSGCFFIRKEETPF